MTTRPMSTTPSSQPQTKNAPLHIQVNEFKLRSLVASDATPEFLSWLNRPSFMAGLNLATINFTTESLIKFINGFDNFNNYLVGIFNQDNTLIGFYTLDVNRMHKTGNITTGIGNTNYQGKGVLWSTIDALLDYFFTYCDIEKITARVLSSNRAMLFNFLGTPRFVFEAKLYKECESIDGGRVDVLIFSTFKNLAYLEKAGKSMK